MQETIGERFLKWRAGIPSDQEKEKNIGERFLQWKYGDGPRPISRPSAHGLELEKKPGLGYIAGETLKGAGGDLVETGKNIGGVAASGLTGVTGFMTGPAVYWAARASGLSDELAKEAKEEYRESIAYQPKSEQAAAMAQATFKPFELFEPAIKSLASTLRKPFNAYTGLDISQEDTENLLETAVVAMPALKTYLQGKLRAGQKPNPKTVERLVKKYIKQEELFKDMAKEQAGLETKPEPSLPAKPTEPTPAKQPWEMTKEQYIESNIPKPQTLEGEVFYTKIPVHGKVAEFEVIKNPSIKQIEAMSHEVRKRHPKMPPDSTMVRTLYDQEGNKYIAHADKAIHDQMAQAIEARYRTAIVDNPRPNLITKHYMDVQSALLENKSVLPEVLKDYPDLAKTAGRAVDLPPAKIESATQRAWGERFFHRSNTKIDTFDLNHVREGDIHGVYFSEGSPRLSGKYTHEAKLHTKKTFVLPEKYTSFDDYARQHGILKSGEMIDTFAKEKAFTKLLRDQGYDSIRNAGDMIVLDPSIIELTHINGKAVAKTAGRAEAQFINKNAGYNIIEEIKKSIQFLKGEDPYKLTKEQIQKEGKSLEPSTSPTLKKILGEEPVEPPMPDAGQIIYDAIKEAKPLRTEQEAIYSTERGKKMAMGIKRAEKLRGKERAEAFRKAQAGKMKKLDFEQPKVPTEAIEEMYDRIWDSPAITEWERLSANSGLTKLLEGKIPQEGEIILLDRVFPKSLTEALKKKRSTWQRVKYGLLEVSGIPRALMASWDFSAPFRQGVFLATRYPKQFFKSFVKMFDMWRSEESYKAVHESITQRETYPLMRQGELALTELDSILRLREEAFMSHWAEKIPLVRRSGRAYTGFLNLLRADVFDTLIKSAEKMGHNPQKSAFLVKSLANFINVASGRGSLKSVLGVNLEKSAVLLNQVLFSPRLMSSRFKLLNPAFYIKAHPFVRRQALQSLLAFVGAGTTVLTLLKAAGAEVELDPTSSKFGKASIGNTTIDIWGGFQQYVRTGAQLAFGQTKSASTGKKTEVKGARLLPYPRLQKGEKGPFAPTSLNIAGRWLEYKQAPLLSFATDLLRGSTAFGEELDFGTTDLTKNPVAQRFIPMVMQDMIDIYKDDPSLLPVSLVGLFGVGLQTYEPRKSKGGVRW